MMKRRGFLLGSLSGLVMASHTGTLFHAALADSLAAPALPGGGERVLVIVNLQGGNDGLNMVVPHATPEYYQARPTIAIPPNDVLALTPSVGLHPVMTSLKTMYDRGQVAVVQGVGYPQPDHSHFRSTEIWQTAAPERFERTGWIGRYLDNAQLPDESLFHGVALSEILPELMVADRTDVPVISALKNYGLVMDRKRDDRAAFSSIFRDQALPFRSPYLGYVTEIEAHAQRGADELPSLINGYSTTASYPSTTIGRSLALAAQMIGSRLGTRVIYVQHGSFDTHFAQRGTQDRLLRELSDALAAFYTDLQSHGNDQRTLTMTFSEFGRRLAENGSRGTDHGEAAPMLVVGPVRGGVYGRLPNFSQLDNGDITYTTDFRSVYATVLENWFGQSSGRVLGGQFTKIPGIFG